MNGSYEGIEITRINSSEIALSTASMTSGGGTTTPPVDLGTKNNPRTLTAGRLSMLVTVNNEYWFVCHVAGSVDIYVEASAYVHVYIHRDSQSNLIASFTTSTNNTDEEIAEGIHTWYVRVVPSLSASVRVSCSQHMDSCTDFTRREWNEIGIGGGYANKEFQIKQFLLAEEIESTVKAFESDYLKNTILEFLVGEVTEASLKKAFTEMGIAAPHLAGVIGMIGSINDVLELIGTVGMAAAINDMAGADYSNAVAISYYQDDLMPAYWTFEVEVWDGKTMYGPVGSHGYFTQMDYYWFE